MREKLPHVAMLAVSVLSTTACESQGNGQDPEDIPGVTPVIKVTNISGDYLPISNSPDHHGGDSQIGAMQAGAEAVARCVWYVQGHPERTSVLVGYTGEDDEAEIEGYVPAEREEDGSPLLKPGVTDILLLVPPCDEPNRQPGQDSDPLEAARW